MGSGGGGISRVLGVDLNTATNRLTFTLSVFNVWNSSSSTSSPSFECVFADIVFRGRTSMAVEIIRDCMGKSLAWAWAACGSRSIPICFPASMFYGFAEGTTSTLSCFADTAHHPRCFPSMPMCCFQVKNMLPVIGPDTSAKYEALLLAT